jgi:hypothetical protein
MKFLILSIKKLKLRIYFQMLLDYPELKETYDDVLIIHNNNLSILFRPLFDENFMGVICNTIQGFETDFFAHDEISNYQINSVYIPYVNMNNFLLINLVLLIISMLIAFYNHPLDASKNIDDKKMTVHFSEGHFEIIVIQNQKLLFNSFDYQTPRFHLLCFIHRRAIES